MANITFRPLHDRVVVRRVESESKTKGGIIIPDTAKEKPQEEVKLKILLKNIRKLLGQLLELLEH